MRLMRALFEFGGWLLRRLRTLGESPPLPDEVREARRQQLVDLLSPGDHLLYAPDSLVGWLIAIKCASRVCHIEVYLGLGRSGASRDGVGVGTYPLRVDDLAYILRPSEPLDLEKAFAWHSRVCGMGYDYANLFNFYLIPVQEDPDGMICSEYATLFDRTGGLEPFAEDFPAHKVHPAHFLTTRAFQKVLLPW